MDDIVVAVLLRSYTSRLNIQHSQMDTSGVWSEVGIEEAPQPMSVNRKKHIE